MRTRKSSSQQKWKHKLSKLGNLDTKRTAALFWFDETTASLSFNAERQDGRHNSSSITRCDLPYSSCQRLVRRLRNLLQESNLKRTLLQLGGTPPALYSATRITHGHSLGMCLSSISRMHNTICSSCTMNILGFTNHLALISGSNISIDRSH